MKKNNVPHIDKLPVPHLVEANPDQPAFEGYRTQNQTREDIDAILSQDDDYRAFSRDSKIEEVAATINPRRRLLSELHVFKLDLDFKRQERRVAKERWEAKKGFFDALGKLGRKFEAFLSPAAAQFRAQKEMLDLDEKNLRKQFELEIEGLQDKLEAVEAYLETADTDLLAEGIAKFGSVKAFIIDMKSNPKSPHYQEINDINKYLMQLAVNRFNNNGMHNAVGVYETEEKVAGKTKKVRKPIAGLAGLRESQEVQRTLNNGLSSVEANMADIASSSLYVRTMLSSDKKSGTRPEWISTKLNPMDDVYITYNPKTGEAVMADELTEAQELTGVGTHNYLKLQKQARKEKAKRWFGNGLKAAFAAGMLLLAGKGFVGNQQKTNENESKAVASTSSSVKAGPAASGVAISMPSATSVKVENPAPEVKPTASAQPIAPKLDKVAKRPAQTAQNPQKAKVSTIPKSTGLEGEVKPAPEVKKTTAKVETDKKVEPKQDAEKSDLLSEEARIKSIDAIIAKISSFQARVAAIDKATTGNGKFFNVIPDLSKIPNELDLVLLKAKALQTTSDSESINKLLSTIDTQLSGIERTIAVQRIAKIHGQTDLEARNALNFIEETIAKLGNKSHKFGIRKVTSNTKTSKEFSETASIMSVDLDAAKAALNRIVERTNDVNQSEAEANKDLETAKKWLGHLKYVKYHVDRNQDITE